MKSSLSLNLKSLRKSFTRGLRVYRDIYIYLTIILKCCNTTVIEIICILTLFFTFYYFNDLLTLKQPCERGQLTTYCDYLPVPVTVLQTNVMINAKPHHLFQIKIPNFQNVK